MSRRIGRTRSNVPRSPAAITVSWPASSVLTLPETGASSICAPLARTFSAIRREAAGLTVLMSTSTCSGPSPARTPSAPRTTCSRA